MKMASLIQLLTLCVSAFQVFAAKPHGGQAGLLPNVILILTDDQGYGDLGRHGHPVLKTPHLDRLHDESVRFDNFYVSPSCSPTRAALLTGMHEFRNGVTHTQQPREHLHRDAVMLPQLLQKAGYRTAFVGKWHLGGGQGYAPNHRGFEWTVTNVGGPRVHFDPVMIRNGRRRPAKGYREDLFFDEAMAFIDVVQAKNDEQGTGNPFFCYLATYSPHTPLAAPEEFIAPFRGKVDEEKATYLAMIANIDMNVGRLMRFLKDRHLDENTIVVFMNDNGVTKGLDIYNAGMRGCKCTIWEGGSRAMSFWRWPGRWQPHRVDNLTAHLDVLPTLCELADVPIPSDLKPKLDGFSLLPLLESKSPIRWHDDRLLFHHVARWPGGLAAAHKYAMCAVRQGDHLLLRSHPCNEPRCEDYTSQCTTLRAVRKGLRIATYTADNAQFHWGVSPPVRWALFNIRKDPACRTDLSADKPDLTGKLARAYDDWWEEVHPQLIKAGGDRGEFPVRQSMK
jgi:arylsulfatase A-like enzyme